MSVSSAVLVSRRAVVLTTDLQLYSSDWNISFLPSLFYRGGNVTDYTCLLVCLSLNKIIEKVVGECSCNF